MDRGLTSMVASTSEHLEKLARGGVLVDTVKGESLPGSVDKAGRLNVFIDGSYIGLSERDEAQRNEMNDQFPLPRPMQHQQFAYLSNYFRLEEG